MAEKDDVFSDANLTAGRRLLLETGFGQELGALLLATIGASGVDDVGQEAVLLTLARGTSHEYAWQEHVPRALAAGLSTEDVLAISRGDFDTLPDRVREWCRYASELVSRVSFPDPWPDIPDGRSPDPFAAMVWTSLVVFAIHKSAHLGVEDFLGWELDKL